MTDIFNISLPLSSSGQLFKNYMMEEGFGDHHIQVYDNWIFNSAQSNVYGKSLTFPDGKTISFENLKIFPPRYTREGKILPLTPKLAREQGVSYGSDWYVDVVLKEADREIDRRKSVCIGTIPTMLKSRNCALQGKTPRQLALFGEDPNDPGGYFIVGGVEKVVLLQEQLSLNRIFLMKMDTKGSVVARMTANTPRGTALIELALDKKTRSLMKMRFPSMKPKPSDKYKSLNVLRIFRLMGISSLEEIKRTISLFIKKENVKKCMLKLTRNAVDFEILPDDEKIVMQKMLKPKYTEEEKDAEITRILEADLFPHLNSVLGSDGETEEERTERVRLSKVYLLAIMSARFLEYVAGVRSLDNRNSWSNKRVEGAGRMMEQLFRKAWRKTLGIVQLSMKDQMVKTLAGVVEKMDSSIVTDSFYESFTTSNWGVKGSQMKSNVSQTLVRDSVVATFAHVNTVDVSVSRTDKQPLIRIIQNDQWGMICPVSTPEGNNAGLLKNLAISAKVALDRSDEEIVRIIVGDRSRGLESFVDLSTEDTDRDKVIVNGKFLGWTDGDRLASHLVSLRRNGELPPDMSVIRQEDWVYVDISPSRLVRPLLIVDEDQKLVIDKLNLREADIQTLLSSGALEYISAWEQEYVKIATTVDAIRDRLVRLEDVSETLRVARDQHARVSSGEEIKISSEGKTSLLSLREATNRLADAEDKTREMEGNLPYTHCELDPMAILGVAASLIPWPNHNQAPRNTYQVSMGKQALGVYHGNHINRYDGKTKILAFPNRPMVESDTYDLIGLDDRGPGENVNMAFMAYPFNEEDSFVVKKEFLENGGFRIYKYLTYKTIVKHSGEVVETLTRPDPRAGEPVGRYRYIQMAESGNPNNGLPMIGAPLRQGDCVIGKIQHVPSSREIRNESVILRIGDEGIVDSVLVKSDNKTTVVTVKLRVMRVPQEGDKFAPRNAQKGTIGIVMSAADMPVSDEGLVPDFIVNPSSLPSRMTISYLMELMASKYGAYKGVHINGGAFQHFPMNEYRRGLKEYDHHEFAYERMKSGLSGKDLSIKDSLIYTGPVFFQALKHHAIDKIQARGMGSVKPMTRQPGKGRSSGGGLRFGEMERDAAISHGASAFLRERLMFVSDAYQAAFCRVCGSFAVNDPTTKKYRPCRLCGSTDVGRCTTPYAYKLLIHLLGAPGINLHPEFVTVDEYKERVIRKDVQMSKGNIQDLADQVEEEDREMDDDLEEMEEDDGGEVDFDNIYE